MSKHEGPRDCRWLSRGVSLVPMPFGPGNCSMPDDDCTYEGDKGDALEDHNCCDEHCPGYEPGESENE